jgi:hypothetical protein
VEHSRRTCTRAVAEWFPRFVEIGHESAHMRASAVLPVLRAAGVRCEKAMFDATAGINTHKGAILSLGLLCAAASRLLGMGTELNRERICAELASVCVGLIDRELNGTQIARTAGERMFKLYGLSGARGEAASGFETVRTRGPGPVSDLCCLETPRYGQTDGAWSCEDGRRRRSAVSVGGAPVSLNDSAASTRYGIT